MPYFLTFDDSWLEDKWDAMYCKSTLKANTNDRDSIKKDKATCLQFTFTKLLKGIEFLFDDGIEKGKEDWKVI